MKSSGWIKHEEKNCPRCKAAFICKVGDVGNCQCNTVRVSEDTSDFLSKTHFDCLCKNCLIHFEQLNKVAQAHRFPTQKEMFIEGLHYYKENGFWVFTELYHLLRGRCCGNGCRHCVYGFKKNS